MTYNVPATFSGLKELLNFQIFTPVVSTTGGESAAGTVVGVSGGGGTSGTRFPWQWPFDAGSYINIGIGSNAAYSKAGEAPHDNFQAQAGNPDCNDPGGYPGGAGPWNCPTWVGTASDPLTFIPAGSDIWWDGVNQAASSIRLTVSATYAAYGDNSGNFDYLMAAFDQTKPRDYWLFNNGTSFNGRTIGSTSGGTFNGTFYPGGEVSGGFQSYWDTTGNGIAKWGQGNTIPVINGNDMDNGYCNRMLPCSIYPFLISWWDLNAATNNLWTGPNWPSNHYNCVWPCKGSDSHLDGYVGGPDNPGGAASGIPFGSVIFIPKAVASAASLGITTKGGLLCFNQLQNYGWLLSNRAGNFVTYGSDDVNNTAARAQTYSEYKATLKTLRPYMRILKSWMYGLTYRATPTLPLPSGYQFDPSSSNATYFGTGMGYNPNAPINGGGTYPPAPPPFDPSLGIGTGGGSGGGTISGTTSITNTAGEVFTITSGGQVAVNGITDAATAQVVELYYNYHTVFHKNAQNEWYAKVVSTAPWVNFFDPTIYEATPGSTYYINPQTGNDTNNGTITAPWASFSHLAGIAAGSVVLLQGTYTVPAGGQIYLDGWGGSAGAPITIMSDPAIGIRQRIQAAVGAKNAFVINNSVGGGWIRFINLEFAGSMQTGITYAAAQAAAAANPVQFPADANQTAISIGNTSAFTHHVWILNCLIHDWGISGINPKCCDYLTVYGNTVYNCGWYSPFAGAGINVYGSHDIDSITGVYKTFIVNNTVYNCWQDFPTCINSAGTYTPGTIIRDGEGILIDSNINDPWGGTAYASRTLISGNLCYNNGHEGIRCYDSGHCDVIFNTCYANGAGGDHQASKAIADLSLVQATDSHAFNNVLYTTTAAISSFNNTVPAGTNTWGNEVWFNTGTGGSLTGAGDLNADPLFASPGTSNFTLQGSSPCKSKATTSWVIPGVDLSGSLRPYPNQSVGAYQ